MNVHTTLVLVVTAYMAALLWLGWWAARLTRSPEEFFLAGRSLGAWVTAVSSTAASESGWVVLGAVGMAYTQGVSALWFAPGCLLGYLVNLYLVAPALRRQSAQCGSLTLPDWLAHRFPSHGKSLRVASVLVILLCLGGYVAAQLTATGKAMEAILGLPYRTGILLGGLVIVAYTFAGGFRAVSWTDFFQGLIMVFALVSMPLMAVAAVGGYSPLLAQLAAQDPQAVSPTGGRSGWALMSFLVGMLGIGLGYPGQPHVLTRYMAAASPRAIRQSQLIAMLWGILVFYGAGFLGLAGRILMPQLATTGDPEQLFPLLAKTMLPPWLAGIMLAAILAAIMSTVSSQLLVAASATSHDFTEQVLGAARTGPASVLAGRLAVLILGLAALWVALGEVRVVFWFVLFAWSGLGAAFGPVVLASVLGWNLTGKGALATILTGFFATVAWKATGLSQTLVYELPPAFALATAAGWMFSHWERRRAAPRQGLP
ncbi:MAG: sodium/proline symporter [Thermoanaerobaculum sp.]|nr:sodium/proline symporter [Thermoanaerobaculum sp.]